MNFLSDVSRCHGDSLQPKGQTCARRRQIERDDPAAWFHYMAPVVTIDGRCIYYLEDMDVAK